MEVGNGRDVGGRKGMVMEFKGSEVSGSEDATERGVDTCRR